MKENYLTSAMDNVLAHTLGEIARAAGSSDRTDIGDLIDRGLVLRRLLEESGFYLTYSPPNQPLQSDGDSTCLDCRGIHPDHESWCVLKP